MTRRLRALNRVVAFLVGAVLLVAGVAAVLWWRGDLSRWWPTTPESLDVAGVRAPDGAWWPWVVLAIGVVLGVLGLWWLAAHLRGTRVGALRLAGSDAGGALTLATGASVHHLERLIRELPRVVGCRAALIRERHRPVLAGRVRVAPDADLDELTEQLTELTAQFSRQVSIPDLGVRVRVQVVRRSGLPRREVE